MAHLSRIIEFLDTLLEPNKYHDSGHNGLQVDSGVDEVITIAGAVDCGLSIIATAVEGDADLLITHHGMYWGESAHVANGMFGTKLRLLMQHPCSLYTSHLPLDGNLEVGNAAEILRLLGVNEVHPFAVDGTVTLGARGELNHPASIAEIAQALSLCEGYGPEIFFPFGSNDIKTIGVCTGAGGFAIDEARRLGIDLVISGEPKQNLYHHAKEIGQSALFIGHYASETFGVKAVLNVLQNTFAVKTFWISEPTGI